MDIIKKQKNTSKQKTPLYNNAWSGAYSARNNNTQKIQAFDEYLEHETPQHTQSTSTMNSSTNPKKKLFWFSFALFIFAILFAGSFFIYRTNNTINQMTDGGEKHSFIKTLTNFTKSDSYKSLNGFSDGRINILLLGRANSHKSGKDLTDTIMMLSINTKDYTVGLFSIPRDFLINNGNYYVKINSLYQTGLRKGVGTKYIIEAVKDITGQDIHYSFVLDFEGFIKIIDILGGINIDVPHHIKDERYPGPGYTYETFEVYPGLQKFDGATALKYARTRHDTEGDFGRAARQQQVMQSARNKAFSLGTIVNPIKINELFNVLGKHVHTDISPNEIEPFISLVKKLDTHNITNVVLDAWKPGSLLISTRHYNNYGGISGLEPRIGNYKEIHEQASALFDLDKIKQRQQEIQNESPAVLLINTTRKDLISARVKNALVSMGFNDVIIKNGNLNTQGKTTVIDNTKGKKPFSLDELIKKLPATVDTRSIIPSQNYADIDFVILLKSDIVDAYTYTEISRDELENENTNSEK